MSEGTSLGRLVHGVVLLVVHLVDVVTAADQELMVDLVPWDITLAALLGQVLMPGRDWPVS